MEFNFTARSIAKLETRRKVSYLELIADYSALTLIDFFAAGLNIDIDDAEEKLEECLEAGGSIQDLWLEVMEGLRKKGFLPKEIDTEEVKKKMKKELSRLTKGSTTSQTSGPTEKKPQS